MFPMMRAAMCVLCGVILCSCASWRPAKVCPGLNVSDEMIVRPELRHLVTERGRGATIALRVPAAPKYLTQETQKDIDRLYDTIEREFAGAGFIVRDRALLEKIFAESKAASYAEIARATETDIIVEVLYLGACDLTHKRYFDPKTCGLVELCNPAVEKKLPGTLSFPLRGGRLDCRVTTVKDGAVSGMFTLYNLPCGGVCDVEVNPGKAWRMPGGDSAGKTWGVGTDEQNVRQLARLLLQALTEGDVMVASVQPDGLAAKYGMKVNDILLKVNDRSVNTAPQALDLLIKADGKVIALVRRGDQEVPVTLVKQFGEPPGAGFVFREKPPSPPVVLAPPPPVPVAVREDLAVPVPVALPVDKKPAVKPVVHGKPRTPAGAVFIAEYKKKR